MSVDPSDVIDIGNRLLERHPDTFSGDFGRNREAVRRLTSVGSIHLRNRIAGYVTRQKQSA